MNDREDFGVLPVMKTMFILWAITLVTLVSCDRRQPSAIISPKPDVADQAIGYARNIVSDPSNWKENSVSYTKLAETAQNLGIEKTPQFERFKTSAVKLIAFGSRWVSNVDEGNVLRLKNDLSRITNTTETSADVKVGTNLSPNAPVGQLEINSKGVEISRRTQVEAEHAIKSSINGLQLAQADEFGKLFEESQSAFLELRALLLPKMQVLPTPSN